MKSLQSLLQIVCISIIFITNAYAQTPMFVSNSENVIRAEKVGSEIFFFKYADSSGTWTIQLWKTNTSASGAALVKSLGMNSMPLNGPLEVINNKLFFTTDSQIWVSDGTGSGTFVLYSSGSYCFFQFNSKLYFSVYNINPALSGMYVSDGTVSGTTLLKNFVTRGLGDDGVYNYVEFNNKIIFTAKRGKLNGTDVLYMEIWSTDGTPGGFVRLDSLYGDGRRYAGGNGPENNRSQYFRAYNGYLYFVFINSTTVTDELWRTDGTVNGAAYFSVAAHPLIEYNGKLILAGGDSNTGTELYSSDGTPAGTTLVKDINTSSPGFLGSNPSNFNITCHKLFFVAVDTGINITNRSRIWVTDGTTNGTILLTPARGAYAPLNLQSNGVLYYAYTDNNNDSVKVFKIDTTTCSAAQVLSWAYSDYGRVSQIVQLNPLFVNVSGGAATNGASGLYGLGLMTATPEISSNNNNQLKLSPNPVSTQLAIQTENEMMNASATVTDLLGRIILQEKLNPTQTVIHTSNLNSGIYLLQIDAEGERLMKKFVKE